MSHFTWFMWLPAESDTRQLKLETIPRVLSLPKKTKPQNTINTVPLFSKNSCWTKSIEKLDLIVFHSVAKKLR